MTNSLKNKTTIRSTSGQTLQKQINDLYHSMTEDSAKVVEFLTQVKNHFFQALLSLQKASKEGLAYCSNGSNTLYSEFSSRIDQVIQDSNHQFKIVEKEISLMIETL
jgi:hypothetical protein